MLPLIDVAGMPDVAMPPLAGFDAVMFGNENDRPYELKVDTASSATMAYVIGRLRDEITVPFGVNVLWDPMSSFAVAGKLKAISAPSRFTPAAMRMAWS